MRRNSLDLKRLPLMRPLALLGFTLIYAPILLLVIFSFNRGTGIRWEGLSLHWYYRAFANETVQSAALLSLQLALVAAIVATVIATAAALATERSPGWRGAPVTQAVITQPLLAPEIVTAIALLIVTALIKVSLARAGIQFRGEIFLYIIHASFCVPFAYLPIRARLQSMEALLEQAAADLYATPWQAFRRVTLPLMMPGILAGFMLAFVVSLDEVVITNLVKAPGQETLPTFMIGQLRRIVDPEINAISALILAASLILVGGMFLLTRSRTLPR